MGKQVEGVPDESPEDSLFCIVECGLPNVTLLFYMELFMYLSSLYQANW